jgi:NADPH:quinone reductase-like Zn-dependent oxidoreductase
LRPGESVLLHAAGSEVGTAAMERNENFGKIVLKIA